MTNLETITAIDAGYEPDPDAMIPVVGQWQDEKTVYTRDFEVVSDPNGEGPAVWPGAWFLGCGGIYFNPVNLVILGEVN